MSTENALSYLLRAKRLLDHVGRRTKTEEAAANSVRQMIEAAERELSETESIPSVAPPGAREGISVESRAKWRRGR